MLPAIRTYTYNAVSIGSNLKRTNMLRIPIFHESNYYFVFFRSSSYPCILPYALFFKLIFLLNHIQATSTPIHPPIVLPNTSSNSAMPSNILGRFDGHRHHEGNHQHPLFLKPPIQTRSKWNEQPDVIDDPYSHRLLFQKLPSVGK